MQWRLRPRKGTRMIVFFFARFFLRNPFKKPRTTDNHAVYRVFLREH